MENTVTLRISRSGYIEESMAIALIRLDTFTHIVGQPVMVRYYNPDNTVDAITVIGIKNGIGRDCYSIISTSGISVVQKVYKESLPDVSELVNGAYYICKNELNEWVLAYIKNNTVRSFQQLPSLALYYEIDSKRRWFYKDEKLKREDDFLTEADSVNLMLDIIYTIVPIDLQVTPQENPLPQYPDTITNPSFKIKAINYAGVDILGNCTLKIYNNSGELAIRYTDYANSIYKVTSKVNRNDTYTIEISYDTGYSVKTIRKKINYKYIEPLYFGSVNTGFEVGDILNLETMLFDTSEDKLELIFNLSEELSFVAVPPGHTGFSHIYDIHGNDYMDDYTVGTMRIRDKDYTTYLKKDEVTIDNFKQIFIK